jgi:adenylate cyclase
MPAGQDEGHARKLVAILAADVAGYSRLMADDEVATMTTLTAYREVFAEHVTGHKGRIVDTAGDSVLATFESVVEAVEAAVAVQRELAERNAELAGPRKMHFRIGVNLGDILIRDDGTIYGDGVNVAARLESLAEPGGVMIADFARLAVEGKLDVGLEDAGEHEVKNIEKPVRAWRVLLDGAALSTPKPPLASTIRRPKVIVGLAAAVVIGLAVWGVTVQVEVPQMVTADGTPTDDPVLAMPTGPSIAVLPFNNMSGDPDQEYFADGITEDIITQLSHFPDYMVIARNTTFQYKGQAVDVAEIGRDLGVRFVLEGSVRRDGEQVRITAQLIDTGTGGHVWADSFDGDLAVGSIFDIQDEITEQVTTKLADTYGVISLSGYKHSLARDVADLSAYECVLGAHGYYGTNFTPGEHARVRECLERAVEIEPNYADAWAWLAAMYRDEHMLVFNTQPNALDRAEQGAGRALAIDSENQQGNLVLAHVYFFRHDLPAFTVQARRTVRINPNSADGLASMGIAMAYAGHWEEGLAWTRKAMKLNPKYPAWFHSVFFWDYFRKDMYQEALQQAELSYIPGLWTTENFLVTVYGKLGRVREAKEALTRLLDLYPTYSLIEAENFLRVWNFNDDLIGEAVDGLRKAGLPDGEPEAPSRPTIAVLPFDNMSEDSDQLYFAHGITEDIITRLAQFPDLLVLGRNTTFQFEGQAVDIPTIAEKLGADYVVEGSVRRGGDTVRVTAQLLEGKEGTHVWAETFDRALDPANIFAVQDEITATIASTIGDRHGVIGHVEYERSARVPPRNLSSYDCVLRYFEYHRLVTAETHSVARDCFESALKKEPDYGDALTMLGDLYLDEYSLGLYESPSASMQQALDFAERGVAKDPESSTSRIRLARVLALTDHPSRAVREAEESLRLSPNNSEVLGRAGNVFNFTGQFDRAQEMLSRVTILNPNYPPWMNWGAVKAHIVRGEYADAVKRLEMTQMGWWYWTTAFIAAAQCADGNNELGKQALESALEANPNFREVYWREMYFWNKGPESRPMIDAIQSGLEACGWDVPPDPGREAFAPVQ